MTDSRDAKRLRFILGFIVVIVALLGLMYFASTTLNKIDEKKSEHRRELKEKIETKVLVMEDEEEKPVVEVEASAQPRQQPDETSINGFRSRAKLELTAIYEAQKNFFKDHNRYSTDLIFIGWSPDRARMDFKLGFLQEYRPAKLAVVDGTEEDPSRMDSDEFLELTQPQESERVHYGSEVERIKLADFEKFCRKGCSASDNGFEVLVVIPVGSNGKVDVWMIDDKKKAQQVWDGVAAKALR